MRDAGLISTPLSDLDLAARPAVEKRQVDVSARRRNPVAVSLSRRNFKENHGCAAPAPGVDVHRQSGKSRARWSGCSGGWRRRCLYRRTRRGLSRVGGPSSELSSPFRPRVASTVFGHAPGDGCCMLCVTVFVPGPGRSGTVPIWSAERFRSSSVSEAPGGEAQRGVAANCAVRCGPG